MAGIASLPGARASQSQPLRQLFGRSAPRMQHNAAPGPINWPRVAAGGRRARRASVACRGGAGALPQVQPAALAAQGLAPCLAGGGGGIFFFWQLGAVKYLQQRYDLARVQFVGASAGALLVTVAACRVDPDTAVEAAYRLSVDARLWERRLGLLGIWGGLIRSWLDEILPPDAAERCRGRLRLVVTDVWGRKQAYLEGIQSRDDLIAANLCSIHIPFFLDWRPVQSFRGRPYVDGSLADFVLWQNSQLLLQPPGASSSFVLDYSQDTQLAFSRLDFVRLKDYAGVQALVQQGYAYAQRTDAAGGFDPHFGGLRL